MNNKAIFKPSIILVFALAVSNVAYADYSLAAVTGNLHFGASVLVRFMWLACIIVGVLLFVMSLSHYQMHRRNPKMVPLGQPITYFLLAFVALGIPFAETIMRVSSSDQANEQNVKETTGAEARSYSDIDDYDGNT